MDVAEAAGVSVATVSRVLNGTGTVSAPLKRRVERVSEALGYRPNPHARALHTGRSNAIGIAATYIGGLFGQLFDALEAALTEEGYRLLVASGDGARDGELAILEDLLERRVDGLLVFLEAVTDDDIVRLARRATPTMVLGRTVPELADRCLSWDQRAGGALATQHLIARGHTRVAHITGPAGNLHARQRRLGFVDAMRGAGLEVEPGWIVEADFHEAGGRDAMRALLDRSAFTAAFVSNDQMALGALNALWERGLRCPEDVSLVGFDDQPLASFTAPPLTTVRQPLEHAGALAASRLLAEIRGEDPGTPHALSPLTLVQRASVRRRGV